MRKKSVQEKKVEIITFKYRKASDYRVIAVNGAYGGPLPTGEIKADFFIEFREAPDTERFELRNNKIGPLIKQEPGEETWIRELQIGLVFSRNTANSIANWLLEKVKKAEEQEVKVGQKSEQNMRSK